MNDIIRMKIETIDIAIIAFVYLLAKSLQTYAEYRALREKRDETIRAIVKSEIVTEYETLADGFLKKLRVELESRIKSNSTDHHSNS